MYLFWRRVLERGGGTTAFPISADGRNLRTKVRYTVYGNSKIFCQAYAL
jgi:hypothetical protein